MNTSALNIVDYIVLLSYLGAIVGMGFWFARHKGGTEGYFLGGRKIPWWAVGLSIFGTSLSAITYLSIPAKAYATDWVFIFANLGILFAAPFVTRFYLPRLRALPITTAYEFLEQRYSLPLRIYGSLCFMIFQMGRIGIVMLLPAIALSTATGMDVRFCILAMGVLATFYTMLGGIEAVIWTDVLQAFVLTAGAILALIMLVVHVDGGLPVMLSSAEAAGKLHAVNWRGDLSMPLLWMALVGNAFSCLYPATADQTVVQRYLSTPDVRQAAKAVWTNALLTIPISLLFFSLGTALWCYYQQHPQDLVAGMKNDAVLPLFVVQIFPAGLRGLFIAGVFAAAMSSLDSSINSVSSVLVTDYYRRFIPTVSERQALRAARGVTILFGLIGTAAALYVAGREDSTLWEPFLKLLNFVGSGLAGIFALGVFTRRANTLGALAGAAYSALVLYVLQQSEIHFFLHGMAGFLTAFIVGYGLSLLFPTAQSLGRDKSVI